MMFNVFAHLHPFAFMPSCVHALAHDYPHALTWSHVQPAQRRRLGERFSLEARRIALGEQLREQKQGKVPEPRFLFAYSTLLTFSVELGSHHNARLHTW
jgi:hypothetical protein